MLSANVIGFVGHLVTQLHVELSPNVSGSVKHNAKQSLELLSAQEPDGQFAVHLRVILMPKRAGYKGHFGTQNLVEKSEKDKGDYGQSVIQILWEVSAK